MVTNGRPGHASRDPSPSCRSRANAIGKAKTRQSTNTRTAHHRGTRIIAQVYALAAL